MTRLFIDTNVVLDYLLDRQGADEAYQIFRMAEAGEVTMGYSFLSIANTAYVLRRVRTKGGSQ